jgi:hypothetical protein
MGEAWTREQFEDHWFDWAPSGTTAAAIPCGCGHDECHGWRMKGINLPPTVGEFGTPTYTTIHDMTLRSGDKLTVTETMTVE